MDAATKGPHVSQGKPPASRPASGPRPGPGSEPARPADGAPGPGAAAPEDQAPPPAPLGAVLADARRAAGLTVEQVSELTRVRAPLITAIERGDFSGCGGDVYARGHLRSLAHAVGADAEALVARYDAEHGAPHASDPVPIFERGERIRPERRRPNWIAAMVAAIVVVVAFVGVNLLKGHGSTPDAGSEAAGTTHAAPSRTPAAKPSPKPAPSRSAVAAAPADRVTVRLTAAAGDRSWIQVTDGSGATVFQKILEGGQSKTFSDKDRLKLILGNAGAVRLAVNGKDLGPAGGDGQIKRLTFTKGDPTLG